MNRPFDRNIDSSPHSIGACSASSICIACWCRWCCSAFIRWAARAASSVYSAQLFFGATSFYLCFGLVSVVLVRRRLASAHVQTILQATVDIAGPDPAPAHLRRRSQRSWAAVPGAGRRAWRSCCRRAARLFLAAVAAIAILCRHHLAAAGRHHRHQLVRHRRTCSGVVLFVIAAAASFVGGPHARKRGLGSAEGRRPGKPGRAIPIHRAAPARKPAGRRRRRQDPSHQRVGGGNSRRRSRRPGRTGRRGIAAPAVLPVDLAAARTQARIRPRVSWQPTAHA